MTLNVPKNEQQILFRVADMDEDQYRQFYKALQQAKAALSLNVFASRVSSQLEGVEIGDLQEVIRVLGKLLNTQANSGKDTPAFVADIVDSLYSESENRSLDVRPKLEERLSEILGLQTSVGLVAKAQNVLTDHDHVYLRGKIATDVRPIFTSDADSPPPAAVLVHTLKLSYRKDGRTQEFYIALDTSDVKSLRLVLDRAEAKARQLESLLGPTGIDYLDVEERN